MTDTPMVDDPTTELATYVPPFLPLENISPFTLRDGYSYLEVLSRLKHYINTELVPFVNAQVGILGSGFQTEVNKLIDTINLALTTQENNVNAALTAQTEYVDGVIATEKAHVDTSIADLTTYINQQIQSIVDNSLEANEAVVRELITTATTVQAALDGRYLQLSNMDTETAALITDQSNTRDAMDARYFRSSGTTLDVAHGGTGRSDAAIANGILAAGAAVGDPHTTIDPGTPGQFLVSNGPGQKPGMKTVIDDNTARVSTVYSSSKVEALVAGKTIYDTFANRPAANTVKDGTIFECSDLPEQYMAKGNSWMVIGSGGNELGYAEINAQTATTAGDGTTPVPIVGLATTFKVGVRPIRVLFCADVANELANSRTIIDILLDGVVAYSILVPSPSTPSVWVTGTGSVRLPAAIGGTAFVPGSTHTISTRVRSDTAGGRAHVTGNPGSPGNLQVVTA